MTTDSPTPLAPGDLGPSRSSLGCLTILGIGAMLVCLLVGMGVAGLRWYMLRQIPVSELAEFERFRSEPVNFPVEWAEAEPYDPALLAAEEDVSSAWTAVGGRIRAHLGRSSDADILTRIQKGEVLSEDDLTTLVQLVADSRPFLDESSRTLAFSDYQMSAAPPGLATHDFDSARVGARSAAATAHNYARQEQWDTAFDYALLPLRRAQRHPATGLITHMVAIASEAVVLKSMARLALECPDAGVLRRTLRSMTELRERLIFDELNDPQLLDNLAMLRDYRRGGYPVDLAPGKPMSYYRNLVIEGQLEFPTWMVENLPPGDPLLPRYQRLVTGPAHLLPGGPPVLFKLANVFIPEAIWKFGSHSFQEHRIREQVVQAGYDLTLLLLARRILELEGKTPPEQVSAYVPEFLPSEPLDPFSGAPYLWDATGQRFYSVGPDGVDDKLSQLYDPGNGTTSQGDVAVPD